MHVRDTLPQLVKVYLKDKFPQKQEPDVVKMVEEIKPGQIEEWIVQKILEKMYEVDDANKLSEQIRDHISNYNKNANLSALAANGKRMTRIEKAATGG